MQIQLTRAATSKLENMIEHMYTRYNLEDLTPDELVEALIDVGVDLVIAEDGTMPVGKARLLDYCGRKIEARFAEPRPDI